MPKRQLDHRDCDREIGARIKTARVLRGWSQAVLAERVGITYQQIHKYERGINQVSPAMMRRLAVEFGIPASQLLDGCGDSAPLRHPVITAQLMRSFARLPDGHQVAIAALVRALAEGEPGREAVPQAAAE